MPDEQVGLNENLRRLIQRSRADGKALFLHLFLQVFYGEGSFYIVCSTQNGKPFLGLSQLVSLQVES